MVDFSEIAFCLSARVRSGTRGGFLGAVLSTMRCTLFLTSVFQSRTRPLNWIEHINNDICKSLSEPVIKEWVEGSCEQMVSQHLLHQLSYCAEKLCFWRSDAEWHCCSSVSHF